MKKVLKSAIAIMAVVALSSTAYSQGLIGFANSPSTLITDMNTGGPTDNSTTVGLYYSTDSGADVGSYTMGGSTPIVFNGLFNNGGSALALPEAAGTTVYVEIRAWDNGAASYEEAIAAGTGNAGVSGRLNPMVLGGGAVPTPALTIQGGFTGFAISPVPEPSTIALGILGGVGALVLLRRRK